jgi:hypothetical protein
MEAARATGATLALSLGASQAAVLALTPVRRQASSARSPGSPPG